MLCRALKFAVAALVGLQVFFLFSCTGNNSSKIAVNGKSLAVIVVSEDATPVESHAAEELAHYLGRVTGAEFTRSPHPREGMFSIWVGTPGGNPAVEKMGVAGEIQALSDHGFILKSGAGGLLISGREPLGVLYGVYAFLEEHAGVRWLIPGEGGEYCPEIPVFEAGDIHDIQNPAFERRTMAFGGTNPRAYMKDTWDWIVRNRMHFYTPKYAFRMHREEMEKRGVLATHGGHVLMNMVPDALYDEHPEYFALVDGERIRQRGDGGRHLSQPCTSHPEVIRMAAGGVITRLREEPEGGVYRFLNNDVDVWCECDNCRAIDPPGEEDRRGGDVSTRYFTFVNEVSRRVMEEMPGSDIEAYAYQGFRLPPEGVRPECFLTVVLCDHYRCYSHSLADEDCEPNSWFRGMYEGWAGFENPKSNFTYYNSFTQPGIIAAPLEKVIAEDLRYMHSLGFSYWNFRTMPPDGDYSAAERAGRDISRQERHWRANAHSHYIQAKLAWDPALDFNELLADFNDKFYGPAGDAMTGFRAGLIEFWGDTDWHYMYGSTATLLRRTVERPGAVDELLAMLAEAEEAVRGEKKYLSRVREDRELFVSRFVSAEPPGETVYARRTEDPVKIDGVLDERDWADYDPVTGFIGRAEWGLGGEPVSIQTYVRFLHDGDNLYIALEMEEPRPDRLVMEAEERDSSRIWGDDTVEIFIDTEMDGVDYVHIVANPAGVFRDSYRSVDMPPGGDPGFEADIDIAASVEDGKWVVEMRISAESLNGVIREGESWAMDVGRVRRAGERREVSSWMDGSFHQPENFRRLLFTGSR